VKLVHQLSLVLTAAVLLIVLAISTILWWNLRAGFSDYLASKDEAQLERMAHVLTMRAYDDPTMDWLRGSRDSMESVLREFRGFERRPPIPYQMDDENSRLGRDGRPIGPPPAPDSIEGWMQIYDGKGEWLAGRPQHLAPTTVWPVYLKGEIVAEIRLFRGDQLQSVDERFLERQVIGLAGTAFIAFLLALLGAWAVSKRLTKPLGQLQHMTSRIAAGEFDLRVPPKGAQEIVDLINDVNAMTGALDALQRARRLWIAQISHELRTPLSVLRGELEGIQDGVRQPDAKLIQNLHDEVMQLGRLVGDLHLLSIADLGQLPCDFQTSDVLPAFQSLLDRYATQALEKGFKFSIFPDSQPRIMAHWDWQRMTQVLVNLFENSMRYTVSPGTINVSYRQTKAHFYFSIEDSPPTVSNESLQQIFEPLYRADSARTRGGKLEGGSGLGLSIVRAIVVAHHGEISASPSKLGGIHIQLKLPLQT
jgi:two-component system, OmpR family, sensor histidine kinase BaeS